MATICRIAVELATAFILFALFVAGCGGGAQERATFAQAMSAPAEGLTASTHGPAQDTLVIHLLKETPPDSAIRVQEKRLPLIRSKGFTHVEVKGSDGTTLWEKHLD